MNLPPELRELELSDGDEEDPVLPTALLKIDRSTISYYGECLPPLLALFASDLHAIARSENQGSYVKSGVYRVADQGWMTVETLFINLNTSYTPSGRFPVYSNGTFPDADGTATTQSIQIGHDAAVCVQKYDPWIVEACNTSTRSSLVLRIVGEGDGSTSLLPEGDIQGARIANTRYLNTTGKDFAFSAAHFNSVGRMGEANDHNSDIPSPIVGLVIRLRTIFLLTQPSAQVVSFTDSAGPEGYTELSPDRFAIIRALVSAANALSYLVGSAPIVAQSYGNRAAADTTFKWWKLMTPLLLILIMGIIGELFVPTLPLNIPRREFGVYSWLALFQSQARGFSVPCTTANRTLTFRSSDSRRLMNSISS